MRQLCERQHCYQLVRCKFDQYQHLHICEHFPGVSTINMTLDAVITPLPTKYSRSAILMTKIFRDSRNYYLQIAFEAGYDY